MTKSTVRGIDYLKLVLLSVGGICLELLLALVEPHIYGQPLSFENQTIMFHWAITYVLWLGAIVGIVRYATLRYGFRLNEGTTQPVFWQYAVVVALLLLSLGTSYMSWGGFKLQREFVALGLPKFIMQYLYYFIETMFITLIIVFGQKAFEVWFKNASIPYGGILCALTWGLVHIVTKSSIAVGLLGVVGGFGFGAVYLLLNRNILKTFPVIFLMFIL